MSAKLRDSLEWMLMVAMIFGGGAIAQAQNDAATAGRATSRRGQDRADRPRRRRQIRSTGRDQSTASRSVGCEPEPPKHWIGILGGPVTDELRAQIDIPADQGVLVRQVVPDSPADKAGLKAFDILLKANDRAAHGRRATSPTWCRSQGESGEQDRARRSASWRAPGDHDHAGSAARAVAGSLAVRDDSNAGSVAGPAGVAFESAQSVSMQLSQHAGIATACRDLV